MVISVFDNVFKEAARMFWVISRAGVANLFTRSRVGYPLL